MFIIVWSTLTCHPWLAGPLYLLILSLKSYFCCVDTRIDWASKYISSYFSSDGLLQKFLNKDLRSLQFHTDEHVDSSASKSATWRCCGTIFKQNSDLEAHRSVMRKQLEERAKLSTMLVVFLSIHDIHVSFCWTLSIYCVRIGSAHVVFWTVVSYLWHLEFQVSGKTVIPEKTVIVESTKHAVCHQ